MRARGGADGGTSVACSAEHEGAGRTNRAIPVPSGLPVLAHPWIRPVGPVGELWQLPDTWDVTYDLGWTSCWNPTGLGKGVFECDPRPIDPDAPLDWGANGYSRALVTCPRDGFNG